MKADIVIVKRSRACAYCGTIVNQGDKIIETIDWIPNQKFPNKKNVCWECLSYRTVLIPVLEELLKDLRVLKIKEGE